MGFSLKSQRMTDSTPISEVDNGLGAAETAVGGIFGIEMDSEFEDGKTIFGSVDNQARVTGIVEFYNSQSGESVSAGLSLTDSSNDRNFRLIPFRDGLEVWKREPANDPVGTFIRNIGIPETFLNLQDCLLDNYDDAGYSLVIGAGGIDAVPPTVVGDVAFDDLTDVQTPKQEGQYLKAQGGFLVYDTPGGGVGQYTQFIELDDTPTQYSGWGQSTVHVGSTEQDLLFSAPYFSSADNGGTAQDLNDGNLLQFNNALGGTLGQTQLVGSGIQIFVPPDGGLSPGDQLRDAIYLINYSMLVRIGYFIDPVDPIAYEMEAVSSVSPLGYSMANYKSLIAVPHRNTNTGEVFAHGGSFMARTPRGHTYSGLPYISIRANKIDGSASFNVTQARVDIARIF